MIFFILFLQTERKKAKPYPPWGGGGMYFVQLRIAKVKRGRKVSTLQHLDGWFPEKLIKDIHSVVLGAKVKQDNPELLRAKELGMLIQSIPEFIFQRTRSKTRCGSSWKVSVLSGSSSLSVSSVFNAAIASYS